MFRWLFRQPARPALRRKSRRPELEILEDRTVPTILAGSPFDIDRSSATDRLFTASASAGDASKGTGEFNVAAWITHNSNTNHDDVEVAGFVAQAQVAAYTANDSNSGNDCSQPSVAVSLDGTTVVAWTEKIPGTTNQDVHYAVFAIDGTPLQGGTGTVGQTDAIENDPHVAIDAKNRFVISYTAEQVPILRNGTLGAATDNVVAVLFDGSGAQQTIVKVGNRSDRDENQSHVDMNAKGRFVVTYFQSKVGQSTTKQQLVAATYTTSKSFKAQMATRATVLGAPRGGQLIDQDVSMENNGNCIVVYNKQLNARHSLQQLIAEKSVGFRGGVGRERLLEVSTQATNFTFGSGLEVAVNNVTHDFVIAFCDRALNPDAVTAAEFDKKARLVASTALNDPNSGNSVTEFGSVSIDDFDDKSNSRADNYFVVYRSTAQSGDIYGAFGTLT